MSLRQEFFIKTKRYLAAVTIATTASFPVAAELVVNRSIVIFDTPAQLREDVELLNTDTIRNMFVDIEAFSVTSPGQDDEMLVSMRGVSVPDLVATPQKAILGPSTTQLIRFMNLDRDGEQEKVYRVNVTPVSRPVEFVLHEIEEGAAASKIQIVIAYQVLVIIPPANPELKVDYQREGTSATFANTGNTNYLLNDGKQCDPLQLENCVDLGTYRIYPGNHKRLELPFDGPFSYKVRTVAGITSQHFE